MRPGTGRVWLLASLLLSACNQDGATSGTDTAQPQPYEILSVLPTPVTPGTPVTAYGSFSKGTSSLNLEARSVPVRPVQDGLSFTVPDDLLAGTFSVSVANGKGTPGHLEVRPRLDSIGLESGATGPVLTLRGAGWGAAPLSSAVSVEVGGRILSPELSAAGLRVSLPADLGGNGSYAVRVRVGSVLSNARSFSREAGHLNGKVLRPLQGQSVARPQTVPEHEAYRSVLVPEGTPAPVGSTVTPLPALKLTRLTFGTAALAQHALTALQTSGVRVQADAPVTVGGSVATLATSPLPKDQWFWPLLGLSQGWARTHGEGVTVAVVDTGILLSHPAFKGRLWPGLNVVDGTDDPTDLAGHGTHVAGLIAAAADPRNGVNVTGAAPGAMLLPVKVLSDLSGGTVSDLVQGLLWAVDDLPGHPNPHPAQVINLSLGTPESSELLADAVRRAQKKGALLVAATGNDGGPLYYPAAYPGVLAVTSVSGQAITYQPSYANRGAGTRIAAYGGDQGSDQNGDGVTDGILSTDLGPKGTAAYAYRQGTSMAAPEVSGLAALALAGGVPPALLKATLEGHASDLGFQGFDADTGWGVANADPARVDDPRVYVVAQDSTGKVLEWTTTVDGAYTLSDLPPGTEVTVTALGDHNNDGVLSEAGDLGSAPLKVTVGNAGSLSRNLQLRPVDGRQPLTLGDQGE